MCSDAADYAKKLCEQGAHPDVIVVDPPRKGCDAQTIDSMVMMQPKRIVYVSCDPGTLARDLKLLEEKGYDPLVYRFFCLQSHYRKGLVFSLGRTWTTPRPPMTSWWPV